MGLTVTPVFGGVAGGVSPMPVGLRNPLSKNSDRRQNEEPSKSSDVIQGFVCTRRSRCRALVADPITKMLTLTRDLQHGHTTRMYTHMYIYIYVCGYKLQEYRLKRAWLGSSGQTVSPFGSRG